MKTSILFLIGISNINKIEGIKTSTVVKVAIPVVFSSILYKLYKTPKQAKHALIEEDKLNHEILSEEKKIFSDETIIYTLLSIICLWIIGYILYTSNNPAIDTTTNTVLDESKDIISPLLEYTTSDDILLKEETITSSDYLYMFCNLLLKAVICITIILLSKIILSLSLRFYGFWLAQISKNDDEISNGDYLWITVQIVLYESNPLNAFIRRLFIFLLSLTSYFKTKSVYKTLEDNMTAIWQARKKISDCIYFRYNVYLYIHLYYNVLYHNIIKRNIPSYSIDVDSYNSYIDKNGYKEEKEEGSPLFTTLEKSILKNHFKKSENIWQEIKKIVYQEFIEPIFNVSIYWKYGVFFQNRIRDYYNDLLQYLNDNTHTVDEKFDYIFNNQLILKLPRKKEYYDTTVKQQKVIDLYIKTCSKKYEEYSNPAQRQEKKLANKIEGSMELEEQN